MFQHGKIMMNILGLALFLFVVIYGGVSLYISSRAGILSVPVILRTEEEVVAGRAFFVRDERPLYREAGIVDVIPYEGERVAMNQPLAVYYTDTAALQIGEELRAVERQIYRLNATLSILENADAAALERDIAAAVLDIVSAMGEARAIDTAGHTSALRDALFRRAHAFGEAAPLEAARLAYEERRDELRLLAPRGRYAYNAPVPGYFSSVVDGYELVLTPEWLRTAAPSDFDAVQPITAPDSFLGKLVTSFTWRLAIPLPRAEAAQLTVGREYDVRLNALPAGTALRMRVERISAEEDGRRVVVLSSGTALPLTIGLRHVTAEIVLRRHTGLRVPIEAIRFDEEAGRYGVFCNVAMQAVFKPIVDIYRQENYWIVEHNPHNTQNLMPGDQVIIAAMNLYHGRALR
jgi:hypothetical protein